MTAAFWTRWSGYGLLILALNACTTTPPAQFYLLSPLPEAAARREPLEDEGPAIHIGPFRFPDFLDRPQILARSGSHEVTRDEFHRWAGDLPEDFERILGENLAHLLHSSRIQIYPQEVPLPARVRLIGSVLRFGDDGEGQAVLRVRWMLLVPDTNQVLLARESTYRARIPGEDREALVRALSETLGAFSRETARAIQTRSSGAISPVRPGG